MYVGILRSGETKSEIFPELQIISQEQFSRVQTGREQRAADYDRKCEAAWGVTITLADQSETTVSRPPRFCPKRNTGKTLLSGNVFCGHCGGRIFASTARKTHHSKVGGVNERIAIYKCYNRTQHKQICDGPSTYRAAKVDAVVDELLRGIFKRAKAVKEQDFIKKQTTANVKQHQQQLGKAKTEHGKAVRELSKWEDLMLDSIEGTCVFTPEQVKKRMDATQQKIDDLTDQIHKLQEQISEANTLADELLKQHQRILSWADLYDDAAPEEKRMIASYVIKAVTLSKGYNIQVEFNISETQYLNGLEIG